MSDNKEFDVEKGLARLEEINNQLSTGDVALGDAMKLYKEGMELAAKCKESIEGIKQEIEVVNATDAN